MAKIKNDLRTMRLMAKENLDIRMSGHPLEFQSTKKTSWVKMQLDEATAQELMRDVATGKHKYYIALYVINKEQFALIATRDKIENDSNNKIELDDESADFLELSAGSMIASLELLPDTNTLRQSAFRYFSDKTKEEFDIQVTVTRNKDRFLKKSNCQETIIDDGWKSLPDDTE